MKGYDIIVDTNGRVTIAVKINKAIAEMDQNGEGCGRDLKRQQQQARGRGRPARAR